MPAYSNTQVATQLNPGDVELAFSAEQPVTGELSQQFAIGPSAASDVPGVSVVLTFSGAPGAFEYDIYEADSDVPTQYLQVPAGGAITTVNANNVARVDLQPFLGAFVAIYCKAQTANAVNVAASIRRRL